MALHLGYTFFTEEEKVIDTNSHKTRQDVLNGHRVYRSGKHMDKKKEGVGEKSGQVPQNRR